MRYKFFQYPRGVNKGGVLNTEICPTISTSSWENNCFLIEIYDGQETDDPAPKSGGQIKDGCMIDTYNQQIQYDVSCTIRTNINTANHHFIVEECNSKENRSTPTKVSIGTQHKSSFEDNLGGGISRTVKTDDSLATMEEVKIAAMRGRNPDNPNERGKSNGNYQQRLEVNENGTSNTITSVQKDNLVVIPLNTDIDGCSRTIKAQYYKNGRATGVVQIGNIVDDTNIGFKNPQRGRVYSADGLSPCLNCCEGGGLEPKVVSEQPRYRIRKLTPRECFRLMGCDEETIDIIQAAGISNSQQYKLAGNSIVVDVLYHLFRKMFVETENESQQLTLF